MIWTDAIRLRWFEEYPPPTTSSLWVLDSEDQAAVLFTLVDRLTALLTRRVELARLEGEAWEELAFEIAYDRERVRIVNRAYESALRVCPPHATDEAERATSAATPTEEPR